MSKTYPLASKEAMKREPSLEPPGTRFKGTPGCDFTCQHGHQDCAEKPNGDCWLDWLNQEQFQTQMYDAMNDNYLD